MDELDEPEFDEPDDFDDSFTGANAWAPECGPTEDDYVEDWDD